MDPESRHRHVLHWELRAHDDAGAVAASARFSPARTTAQRRGCVRGSGTRCLANPAEVLTPCFDKSGSLVHNTIGVIVSCLTSELAGMTMN